MKRWRCYRNETQPPTFITANTKRTKTSMAVNMVYEIVSALIHPDKTLEVICAIKIRTSIVVYGF
jgi:hypothetical protein